MGGAQHNLTLSRAVAVVAVMAAVRIALEAFGPERCMFGSDWPVCELAGTYGEVYRGLRELLKPLSDHEQQMIFGGTATRFYQLTL